MVWVVVVLKRVALRDHEKAFVDLSDFGTAPSGWPSIRARTEVGLADLVELVKPLVELFVLHDQLLESRALTCPLWLLKREIKRVLLRGRNPSTGVALLRQLLSMVGVALGSSCLVLGPRGRLEAPWSALSGVEGWLLPDERL